MFRQLLFFIFLLFIGIIPARSQEITVVSTVNDTEITIEQFQTRYQLEGLLLMQEITAFASLLYATNPNPLQVQEILQARFPVQLQALEQPEAFAEIILTSMESDILLNAETRPITDDAIDALITVHVATTTPILLPDDADNPLDAGTMAFYEQAEDFAGATETDIRDLFAARVLRQSVFEQVAVQITATDTADETELARQRSQAFQAYIVEQREAATVERVDEWELWVPVEPDIKAEFEMALNEILGTTQD